ncbi:MAG TPA: tetratricopeptide repeat protein [Vicinamibacterales bacterium]|jgi:tetratricopeptide (TPR) repeat protein
MIGTAFLTLGLSLGAVRAEPSRILVVPFETPDRDGRTYWLGEGASIVMTDELNARGAGALSKSERDRAYEQLHLPPQASLSRATIIKVGQLVGAVEVIVGEVRVEGDTLTVRAEPIRVDVGRGETAIVEHGNLADFFGVVRNVAQRIAPGVAPVPVPSPPLQAFEPYVKALLAQQPATQAQFLETALQADPHYQRARLELWEVRTAQGDHLGALAAAKAVPSEAPESRRARFFAAVSLINLKQYDEAFTRLNQLQDGAPDPAVMNNLGIVQLHRAATPESGKAVYYFTKAAEGDPDNSDLLFNLGYAYASDRDPQGAIYWLREALRRDATDADAHFVLAAALDAAGNGVEAAGEREIAGQLSSRYGEGAARRDALPRGLERLSPDLDAAGTRSGVGQTIAMTAQRDQQDVANFHLERGRRLFQAEEDREAMTELRRAVFLSPYQAEAHLLIGRIHLRAGRPREAVDALKISIWSQDTVEARLALADAYLRLNDLAGARAQAHKALSMNPASEQAQALLQKIGG